MVRQDWLKALGLEEPETWEDWLNYWQGVKDHDLNGNGDPGDEIRLASSESAEGERSLTLLLNVFGIAASNDTQFCILDDGTYAMFYEHPVYPEYLEAVACLYDFCRVRRKTVVLRENGLEDALWISVKPVPGPEGERMILERELVSPMWSITAGAEEKGKVEDIVRFFNWCYTEEGSYLYNYGIEEVSYTVTNGETVLDRELVANGFSDYRAVGINYEPFGGYWLQGCPCGRDEWAYCQAH